MALSEKRLGAARRKRAVVEPAVSEGLTPLQYMVDILRDESQTHAVRMDAAKTAAPYMHPRLATAEMQGHDPEWFGEALWALMQRAQQAGVGVPGMLGHV